jgi:hypothetical protein
LGKNVRHQTKAINQQTRAMIATQMATANNVIASQERIAAGIDAVTFGVQRVAKGIYELKSAFEWGISEVVWQIEQNREVLKSIEEGIWSPFDAQARNRKKQAQEAYEYGWIDEAEEYFLESEKIVKTDFSVHISLGMIYLFHKIEKEKALTYFEKAAKYAKPKSTFHTSYAILRQALIKFDFGKVNEAEKLSSEAIELCPDFAEALYQNSQYNAQLSNKKKSLWALNKAIQLDKYYALKASNDTMFDPIRSEMDKLFIGITDRELKHCENLLNKFCNVKGQINKIIEELAGKESNGIAKIAFNQEIEEINKLLKRRSYFDALDAKQKIKSTSLKGNKSLVDIKRAISNRIKNFEQQIAKLEIDSENKAERQKSILSFIINICVISISIALGFKSCIAFDDYVKSKGGVNIMRDGAWKSFSYDILYPLGIFFGIIFCGIGICVLIRFFMERSSGEIWKESDRLNRTKSKKEKTRDLMAQLERAVF